jgi:hypothetical protein
MSAQADDPTTSECDQLLAYLAATCAEEPELWATVLALADAGEIDLLRLVRDFRDNLSNQAILARHGPKTLLDERLRVIHRVYVDCARRVREETQRPLRARTCYLSRMLARRDNYQAMLDDPAAQLTPQQRQASQRLVKCAREKVPYEDLPGRLGLSAASVQEEVLQLRRLFRDWTARRKVRAGDPAPGGLCHG